MKRTYCCRFYTATKQTVMQMNKKKLVATMSLLLGLSYGLSLAATGISVPAGYPPQ